MPLCRTRLLNMSQLCDYTAVTQFLHILQNVGKLLDLVLTHLLVSVLGESLGIGLIKETGLEGHLYVNFYRLSAQYYIPNYLQPCFWSTLLIL